MNVKKQAFLTALLETSTITAASEKANISRTTAYNFLKDPDFQEELSRRKSECIDSCVRYLQGKLAMCSEKLIGIIENKNTADQIKINAISLVYSTCKAMTETAEIMALMPQVNKLNDWITQQEGGE